MDRPYYVPPPQSRGPPSATPSSSGEEDGNQPGKSKDVVKVPEKSKSKPATHSKSKDKAGKPKPVTPSKSKDNTVVEKEATKMAVVIPLMSGCQRFLELVDQSSASINDLRADINTLRTDITTLRTDMNRKLDILELRIRSDSAYFSPAAKFVMITFYSSLNHTARLYNSHMSSRGTPHSHFTKHILEHRGSRGPGFLFNPDCSPHMEILMML